MYRNKSYFIFGFGARNIWVIMKLEHILGLLEKEIGNLFGVNFFIFYGKTINLELPVITIFMQLKMYIWDIPNSYVYNRFFYKKNIIMLFD